MAIDWDRLTAGMDAVSKDFLSIIKPYLPALGRAAPEVFEGFIKHAMDANWAKVDELMYSRMTTEERRELEDEALVGARRAVLAQFDRNELIKDIAFKAMLRLILAIAI